MVVKYTYKTTLGGIISNNDWYELIES